MTRIGLSLITLHPLSDSTATAVRRAADAGYEGVEFVHFLHKDMDSDAVRNAIDATGVEPLGVQVDRKDLQAGIDDILTLYGSVGVSTLVFHANDDNWTERRARDTIDLLERTAEALETRGWDLLVHPNHMDLSPIVDRPVARHVPWIGVADRLDRAGLLNGGRVHDWLALNESRFSKGFNILLDHHWNRSGLDHDNRVSDLERTMLGRYAGIDADLVNFEIDVAFLPIRGYDPVEVLDVLGDRVEQVHVKDIRPDEQTLGRWPVWRPAGDGVVDIQGVVETALANDVDWLTFEHDIRDGDDDPVEVADRGFDRIRSSVAAASDQSP